MRLTLTIFLMTAAALLFLISPNFSIALIAGIPAGLAYGVFTAAVFATYIVGDLVAIPFRYLFARAPGPYQSTEPRGVA